jgi:hypothetical protein
MVGGGAPEERLPRVPSTLAPPLGVGRNGCGPDVSRLFDIGSSGQNRVVGLPRYQSLGAILYCLD